MFLALGGNCVLSLVMFIICSVQHFQSGKFESSYRSPATHYETYGPNSMFDNGTFDLGSWSCQLSAYDAFDDTDYILSRQCIDETAALWISLFLALSNLGMAGLVLMDWRGQRFLVRDYSALVDEYEDYYI